MYTYTSGVTFLFEHSRSQASEIEHFKVFSRPQENQLARQSRGGGGTFLLLIVFLNENRLKAVVWRGCAKKVLLKFRKIYMQQKSCACGLQLYLKRDSVTSV